MPHVIKVRFCKNCGAQVEYRLALARYNVASGDPTYNVEFSCPRRYSRNWLEAKLGLQMGWRCSPFYYERLWWDETPYPISREEAEAAIHNAKQGICRM